jgi:hypothetical protein
MAVHPAAHELLPSNEGLLPGTDSRMKRVITALALSAALSMAAAEGAKSQGKSGNRPHGNHNAGAARSHANPAASSVTNDVSPIGSDGLGFSTDGEVGGQYSKALGDSTFLRLEGSFDIEGQTSTGSDGELRGTVGLGLKF